MSYSEFRVRRAYDEIVFQWDSAEIHGEEYETFLMVLHEDDGYGIDDIIDDKLEEELLDEMTDEDREEVVRRLRVKYPEKLLRRLWGQRVDDDEEDEDEEDDGEVYLHGEPVRAMKPETPEQFEARRVWIWRSLEGCRTPREIRRIVRDTRR
jgi:hypothetical protein